MLGISISGDSVNNLRCADDRDLLAEIKSKQRLSRNSRTKVMMITRTQYIQNYSITINVSSLQHNNVLKHSDTLIISEESCL